MRTIYGSDAAQRVINFLRLRKKAYQLTFGNNMASQEVLIDLAKFCRADESVYHPNQRLTDIMIGRNEVWLRITQHLNLTGEQLAALYNGQSYNPNKE